MKVSRGRQAELSLDLAGQQGQGSLCVRGPAPQSSQLYPERTTSAGRRSKSTWSTQLKWEARSVWPPAHPESISTELEHPQRSWVSTVHKSPKIRGGGNQTGNPRCQKGQKKMKGARETTSRRAQRGQGPLHHHSEHPDALGLQT